MSELRELSSHWLKRLELAAIRRGWPTPMVRSHGQHQIARETDFLDLYEQLHRQKVLCQTISEAYHVWDLCRASGEFSQADIAEAGVYRGGSARLICGVRGGRRLHLFDTFGDHGGMPETLSGIDPHHRKGDFADSRLDQVRRLFHGLPDVHFHPGFFPKTAEPLADRQFSFVHLDMDIYQSTLDGLKFFWPRLAPGGLLISHDYSSLLNAGVQRAFDEYFAGKPVLRIRLWDLHGLVIKPLN